MTPATSLGFMFETFCADVALRPLDPWQRWTAIHALEVLPDGRPRFRQILILVARQNGKTELLVLLTLFWLYVQQVGLVLGTSTKLDYAKESWEKALRLAQGVPELSAELSRPRRANGEQEMGTSAGNRYKIAASNSEGGRSLTIDRLIEDELRQHHDWSAHEAAENAGNAVAGFQAWAISNMGDDRSVVLNALQEQALTHIETGEGDPRLFLAEYSAPDGCELDDMDALAQANPNLGRRIDADSLLGKAVRAKRAGGEQEVGFRTEVLCQRVTSLIPPPIPLEQLAACVDVESMPAPKARIVFALDVEVDRSFGAIAAAGRRDDGLLHASVIEFRGGTSWIVPRAIELRAAHPGAVFVVNDAGPAGSLLAELSKAGIPVTGLSMSAMAKACGAIQDRTRDRLWRYPGVVDGQDLVKEALHGARKRPLGDAWAWDRKSSTSVICPLVAVTEALWELSSLRPVVPLAARA